MPVGRISLEYIELFAGIGGFRLGFEQACDELGVKAKCVFSSEINKFSRQTYKANFGEEPVGDITQIASKDIFPYRNRKKTDILGLFAGFPCQPFSRAGKQEGWSDKRNMIPHMLRIIEDLKPDFFILENVKGFKSKNFRDVYDRLMWDLKVACGYTVYEKVYNANAVVPQHRERIFFVGFKNHTHFVFPELPEIYPALKDILIDDVPEKYFLKESTWKWLKKHKYERLAKSSGFGYTIADVNGRARTISARYGCDGAECLIAKSVKSVHKAVQVGQIGEGRQGERIYDVNNIACTQTSISGGLGSKTGLYEVSSKVRKLTPRECARVMGFPDDFKIVVSDSQAYKQFGNAVVPGVVECIAGSVLKEIEFKTTLKKSRKTEIEYNPLLDAALNTMRNNFLLEWEIKNNLRLIMPCY